MTLTPQEALALAQKIRMDLTNAQGKLTDVIEALAALPDTASERPVCPTCGVRLRGPNSLAEHVYNRHGGPVPEHYAAAEKAAGLATDQ